MDRLKTIVVEDQRLGIDIIRQLLDERFELVAVCQNIKEARKAYEKHHPNVVILDIELPDGSGLNLAREILRDDKTVRILGVSGKTDAYTLYQIFITGFYGFVDKNTESLEELRTAIDQIAKGNCYYAAIVQQNMLAQKSDPRSFSNLLTEREQELLCYLGVGSSNESISEMLGLRPISVQNYRQKIMKKLNLHTTVELIRYAIEKGFVNQWEFRKNHLNDPKRSNPEN